MEITSVLRDLLIPYEGKIVSIKCSNVQCGRPMKVQVPKLNTLNVPQVESNFDLHPTQIRNNQSGVATSVRLKVLKNEKTEEQIFNLREGVNTIGRFSGSGVNTTPDIPILTIDKKISRNYHCALILQRKGDSFEVILRDNHSANGTFLITSVGMLNPEDEVFLENRDVFIIGDTRIQVEID